MIAKSFRTLWGVDTPLNEFIPTLKIKGYHGIETGLLFLSDHQKSILKDLLRDDELDLILTILTFGSNHGTRSVDEHFQSLLQQLNDVLEWKPSKINVHGGCDAWSIEEQDEFYGRVMELEATLPKGTIMMHETHRSRVLFNPWTSLRLLKKFPNLKINCDLSHWVVVCERHLNGPEFDEVFEVLKQRCVHVHARISSTQLIQVYDLDESKDDMDHFDKYWACLWAAQKERKEECTFTVEYGPYPYCLVHRGKTLTNISSLVDSENSRIQSKFFLCNE